jgi:hypothetical protein
VDLLPASIFYILSESFCQKKNSPPVTLESRGAIGGALPGKDSVVGPGALAFTPNLSASDLGHPPVIEGLHRPCQAVFFLLYLRTKIKNANLETRKPWKRRNIMPTIMPEGASVRKAIEWISQMREGGGKTPLMSLIDQACVRFSLGPKDCDFLHRFFREQEAKKT